MTMSPKIATVFGGTGFIGRYIVRELARAGYIVKIAARIPERAYFLRPNGGVGQIVPVLCDIKDQASIENAIRGSDVVVNCIGLLYQRRRGDFRRAHVDAPAMMAAACSKFNVSRFVHLSALGVDRSTSFYARTKIEGERQIFGNFPTATILRPSVVFGPEDQFINFFATLARFFPVLPLIGGGKTKFQPVYVADVSAAVMAAISRNDTLGGVYELGGPEILDMKEIYSYIFQHTGLRRPFISAPFFMAKIKASVLQWIPPKPLLTPDQVESLKTDNIVSPYALGLGDLGVRPTGMELIVPAYLERFRVGGRFANKQTA